VVDDYEPWRSFVISTLQKHAEWQVIGEAADGLEAVQKTLELQPDLVLLDIGLPRLNGIEVARQVLNHAAHSKILFLSENRSSDIVVEALRTGASAYVLKSNAASELLPAMKSVLQGKQFVSAVLARSGSSEPMNKRADAIKHCHEAAFYEDDIRLIDGYARFVESAMKDANAVIVVASELHRARLHARLATDGVDVAASIERGNYLPIDAVAALSRITINDMPDSTRCAGLVRDLVTRAAGNVKGEYARVAVCGEIAPTLLSSGNAEGAIQLEHMWDEITRGYGVTTLCIYSSSAFPNQESNPAFKRICMEHSAVRSQ